MKIYLLIKEVLGYEGETEEEEFEAYFNREEAEQIANAYWAYSRQIDALDDEYHRINLQCHPEWKGKIGELRKENRARVYALQKQNSKFKKWNYMDVIEVNVKQG